ncbi:hypothetical protein HPB50_015649 [Hyalomma asiaticum]|uniref:Uncharacterized protein n=1 Tax=Hyalomma asiaticum TaxID=266040 RepID=A0ACB7TJ77_HYAAI|nr:hypothetical protein HPB50_015649 [Hyalomma asiaticum]
MPATPGMGDDLRPPPRASFPTVPIQSRWSELSLFLYDTPVPILALSEAGLPNNRDFNAHYSLWGDKMVDARGRQIVDAMDAENLCVANEKKPTIFRPPNSTSVTDLISKLMHLGGRNPDAAVKRMLIYAFTAAVRKRSQTAQGMVWSAVQNHGSVMRQRGLSANTAVKCEPGVVKVTFLSAWSTWVLEPGPCGLGHEAPLPLLNVHGWSGLVPSGTGGPRHDSLTDAIAGYDVGYSGQPGTTSVTFLSDLPLRVLEY